MSACIAGSSAPNFRISRWVIEATNKSPSGKKHRPNGRLGTSATIVTLPSRSMRKTFPARTSDTHRAPRCHLGALRRQNPLASTLVFSVFIIFDREIHFSDSRGVHRARSKVRAEEGLGCFLFFIFGSVTGSRSRTRRQPPELR